MLYLVRHGQTPYNAEHRLQGQLDIPLSDTGRRQAHELGRRLKNEGASFDALYSSRLIRAYETAEIVGSYLGLSPKPTAGIEEIFFGRFQGHSFDECAVLFPDAYADFMREGSFSGAHGGETGPDVFLRARAALLSLKEAKEGSALVVCHGAVIGYLRAAIIGRPLNDMTDLIPDNAELIPLDADAIGKLKEYGHEA